MKKNESITKDNKLKIIELNQVELDFDEKLFEYVDLKEIKKVICMYVEMKKTKAD